MCFVSRRISIQTSHSKTDSMADIVGPIYYINVNNLGMVCIDRTILINSNTRSPIFYNLRKQNARSEQILRNDVENDKSN